MTAPSGTGGTAGGDGFARTADQYELVVDGQVVAVVGYEDRGSAIVLLHTATEPGLRRRGYATRLVAHALEDADARNLTVQVRCPFVRAYLRNRA